MTYLEQVILYPIKSLDGVCVLEAVVSPGGALTHDREFAILDERGDFVNGKRNERVHLLRATFDPCCWAATLQVSGTNRTFRFGFGDDVLGLEAWLSGFFGFSVRVTRNAVGGLPDDTEAWGPTVVSRETLEAVGGWFAGLKFDEVRSRFRPNLVIGGVPPFWEDRLFGQAGTSVAFQIGEVRLEGTHPCQRCVVPSRNPRTSEGLAGFQRQFAGRREETLPGWALRSRFDHFYRLCVNTRISSSEAGKVMKAGDEVRMVEV